MQPRRLKGFTYTDAQADPRQLMNYYAALNAQKQQPTPEQGPQKTSKRGGFLSSLISEAFGAVGGAGGFLLGGPGGAVAGASALGTLGRGIENKVRDDQNFFGEGGSAKSAFTEGALQGAFTGVGTGLQALKAAKGSKALASTLGDDVLKTSVKTPTIGMVENKGLGLTSKVGGYHVGATVPGSKPLSPSIVKRYDQVLRRLKIPANDASDLARGVEGRLQQVGNILETNIAKNNISITAKNARGIADDLIKKVKDAPGLGKAANRYAAEQGAKLAKVKDAKGLIEFRKGLDRFINFNMNPDAALAEKQGVARLFRGGIKDRTNVLFPGIKKQNDLYHDLSNINDYVMRAANRGATAFTGAGGGLFGRIATSPTANTLKAKTGAKLQPFGRALAGTGGPRTQVSRQAKLQAVPNLAGALSTDAPAPPQIQQSGPPPVDPSQFGLTPTGTGGFASPTGAPAQQAQSPYSLQQAIADIQRDPENINDYIKFYEFANPASAGGGPNITKITGQQYQLATRGALAVDQLEQLLASDPDVLNKSATPGRKLPIVGGYISDAAGTGDFDAIGYNAASSLLRIETGAQANHEEIKNLQTQMMPRAGDPPSTVRTKIAQLRQAFAGILDTANQGGYGGYDTGLDSLIGQIPGI